MENEGQQRLFSVQSEKNVNNSYSSMFDITGELEYSTALKMKRSSSSDIEEVEEDSSDGSHASKRGHPSSPRGYDSDESFQSYITARDEMEDDNDEDFYGRKSFDENGGFPMAMGLPDIAQDNVFVAVGKGQSSMDALFWMLANCINPSTNIYLIHIYPETRYIPSPLGLLPKQKVREEIVDKHTNQEREKAQVFLQKFLVSCCSSFNIQNKVDAVLIESDFVEKTLLNLIPILKINKLVLGTHAVKTQSRMAKVRKNGIAHKIFINAPKTCDVKLVCEGKQVMDPIFATPMLTPASSRRITSGPSLASPSSSWRSDSTNLPWLRKSKSDHDFQKQEVNKLDKSKSYTDFQLSEIKHDKMQTSCFHPTRLFARARCT